MPPKKKKSTPIVVGTVSTRSTRRESVVNIEIIPKINKPLKSQSPKKTTTMALKAANSNCEQDGLSETQSSEGTRPEILEILKDWSDDEYSQDDNFILVQSSSKSSSTQLADDQQSLIDILEGKQSDSQDVLSFHKTDFKSSSTSPASKVISKHKVIIENPVVNIDSPKAEEPDIIEECVVEDDSIIIVLPEEQTSECVATEDDSNSNVAEDIVNTSSVNKDRASAKISKTKIQNLNITCEADEIIRCLSSEDTSQNVVAIPGEYVQDNNIHLSDNSTNNYEIVEEQIVCDSSEPIIIDSLDGALTDSNSKGSCNYVKNTDNRVASSINELRSQQEGSSLLEHTARMREVISEPELLSHKADAKKKLSISPQHLGLSKKTNSKNVLTLSMKRLENDKAEIDRIMSDENTLCFKMNESMQISNTPARKPHTDPTPEKLQEGISRILIKNEQKIFNDPGNSDSKWEARKDMSENFDLPNEFDAKMNLTKAESTSLIRSKRFKNLFGPDKDISPKISPRISPKIKLQYEAVSKQMRRTSRKKPTEFDVAPTQVSTENIESATIYSNYIATDTTNEFQSQYEIVQKRDIAETSAVNTGFKMSTDELRAKLSKTNTMKGQQKFFLDINKMEVDSESSETKTSEGDSTSNDSNQDLKSNKSHKTKKKGCESASVGNSPISEINSYERENVKKLPKGNKLRENMRVTDEQNSTMEVGYFDAQQDSSKILRSTIDATIDDVLRKFTCEDFTEVFSKENKNKSKDSKRKKDSRHRKDDKNGESSEEVRRSDRIKTILPVKKKSHGLVRSKSEPFLSVDTENSDSNSVHNDSDKPTPSASPLLSKTEKTKPKSKSSENLPLASSPQSSNSPELPKPMDIKADKSSQAEIEARLKTFVHLKENQYKTDRQVCKEARGMICDCYLAEEDIQKDEYGCGEDCLNRLLMIECGELCQVGHRCTNRRFQKSLFAPVEVFKTEKKGLGLRAAANIAYGEFILEYVGEVLNPDEFDKRAEVYSKDKNIHFYFMSLRADAIIDATMRGNISRFINHSCDPNAETQKWTVNGELRIGFFSTRTILAGEEITFDYRFQRYGKEAQKCYCEASTCRGWLGERPDESEDEDEEEEDEASKVLVEPSKADVKVPPGILNEQMAGEIVGPQETDKINVEVTDMISTDITTATKAFAGVEAQELPKKTSKKKSRKDTLYEDFDQLNEDIEMLVTTGLKNQAHTLKLSRLMVRAKDLDQRKKLLRVLRRGELPCRRLFLDYHGLRLMHGYMIDAQQLTSGDVKVLSSELGVIQTKLELLQTLAVLPIQNKTMLIESKVLPAVEKWAKNEDLVEDGDQRDVKLSPPKDLVKTETSDPTINEKIDEIKFLATKLLEEWVNLKESFRIPKKQRIEQMKEHEKEANRKFMESNNEKESSRKHEHRYRSWSRYKSERETSRKSRSDGKGRPSAEFLKISRHERRKLFALQMELKEEERRLKQRELWREHEMNCMMIGTDPRFTAPFDPTKGFQYIWNPSLGQWQALPVPATQVQGVYNSPQAVTSYNLQATHKQPLLGPYATHMVNIPGISSTAAQYPGLPAPLPPMVPGLATSGSGLTNPVHGLSGSIPGLAASLPGIAQPPMSALPMYQEVKQEDPSQVKFAGPIPPPVKLPPKWKCAKDKYGRPYYYHVKLRKSQWEPPPLPKPVEELKLFSASESSSSETSSGSTSDSSSDSETDDEIDDAKLLSEVRKQMEITPKVSVKSVIPDHIKKESDSVTPSPELKMESDNEEPNLPVKEETNQEPISSIDIRLKEQFNLDSNDPPKKRRRFGLCQEIIISPRTAEDRKQFKEDLKRYRATKEKLKRQKEQMLLQAKKKQKTGGEEVVKRHREKRSKGSVKLRIKELKEWNDEHAKKIKELFRSTMATTVVSVLNAYRKPDCREARITNTEEFKHLARKLTHFVMLKEMKHLSSIDELTCTDNVKAKAREYIRKYMSKFGEVYQKRHDEPDFKD